MHTSVGLRFSPAPTILVLGCVVGSLCPSKTRAVPIDLTTFTAESFPRADNDRNSTDDDIPIANWSDHTTPNAAKHQGVASPAPGVGPSVFYSPWSMLNKRITGVLNFGVDRDLAGFVFGIQPSDAMLSESSDSTASYMLLDWKRTSQNFDFFDFGSPGITPFHDLTGSTQSLLGLALSKVAGLPTGDELWGHVDLPESLGGVTLLERGATLGTTGYTINTPYTFSILYTPSRLIVEVDGVEQFNLPGVYGDGRFGLYTNLQGTATSVAVFSDFSIEPWQPGDYDDDLDVDGGDFLLWQSQLGLEGRYPGDGNLDGVVDSEDLAIWTSHFGESTGGGQTIGVPEPTYIGLLLLLPSGARRLRGRTSRR